MRKSFLSIAPPTIQLCVITELNILCIVRCIANHRSPHFIPSSVISVWHNINQMIKKKDSIFEALKSCDLVDGHSYPRYNMAFFWRHNFFNYFLAGGCLENPTLDDDFSYFLPFPFKQSLQGDLPTESWDLKIFQIKIQFTSLHGAPRKRASRSWRWRTHVFGD